MLMFTYIMMQYGFDVDFKNRALFGEFGILSEIKARWPATIELGLMAMLFSILIGIPLGVMSAVNHKNWLDRLLIGTSLMGYSVPIFWLALILILVFSVGFNITPVAGRLAVMYDIAPITGFMLIDTLLLPARQTYHFNAFYSAVSHMILPILVLASMPIAVFARMTRACMLEVLSKDFILTARAKGLSEFRIIFIHGFRNALPAILSTGGLLFITTVIMGSIVTEVIFGWPGIGSYIIKSVYARDYAVVQVFLLMMGVIVLMTNTVLDLIILFLDPRKG